MRALCVLWAVVVICVVGSKSEGAFDSQHVFGVNGLSMLSSLCMGSNVAVHDHVLKPHFDALHQNAIRHCPDGKLADLEQRVVRSK